MYLTTGLWTVVATYFSVGICIAFAVAYPILAFLAILDYLSYPRLSLRILDYLS